MKVQVNGAPLTCLSENELELFTQSPVRVAGAQGGPGGGKHKDVCAVHSAGQHQLEDGGHTGQWWEES